MNYKETLDWLFNQLPMYQSKGKTAYKADLKNSINLDAHLGNPSTKFKAVHVAGTNGKGSTSHMLASVLQESGYKVGLYTSPHLKDYRERIRINGKLISKQFVMGFMKKHKAFFEANSLSFFEMTVGLAFDYFSKKKVDIAIIEVGLGGRLDSTNIITPQLSVITNIGFDHMQFLGNTLGKIATEKAGIIKENIPVVIGETQSETKEVFKKVALANKSKIYFAHDQVVENLDSDLKGNYQGNNIKTVVKAVKILNNLGYEITSSHLKTGLKKVVNNTGLRGRWQLLQQKPKIICDVAHNKEGLLYVVSQLQSQTYNKLHIVYGTVSDKDMEKIVTILPKDAIYYLCKPNIKRGMEVGVLQTIFKDQHLNSEIYSSVFEALYNAKKEATPDDLIFVGGSTFVVAEIL